MIDAVKPDKPDQDKVEGNDEVQQPRHNQNQDACDEGHDRRNVCGDNGHLDLLGDWLRGQQIEITKEAWACRVQRATIQRIRNTKRFTSTERRQFIVEYRPPTSLGTWGTGGDRGRARHQSRE